MKTHLIAAASVAIFSASAFAANEPAAPADRPALVARVVKALDRLDLDKAQRDQIKAVLKKDLPAVKPNIQKLVAEHRALTDIIRKSPADQAAIRAQSAKVAAVQSDLAVQRAGISGGLRAVLRPEQVAEFEKIEKEFRARMDERLSRIGSTLE
jgi:Spy/CpxP family protein refolding chaperone